MEQRHIQNAKQDYTRNNQYNDIHPDALATGDQDGKGTGHGGHTHYLPDCNGILNDFTRSRSQLDTDIRSGAGNCQDNSARNIMFARSVFSPVREYSKDLIDSTMNIAEGQYTTNVYQVRVPVC